MFSRMMRCCSKLAHDQHPSCALPSPLHTPQVGDLNVLLDKLVTIANSWKEEEAGVRRRVSEEQAVVVRELMQVGAWFVGAGFGWGIVLQIMRIWVGRGLAASRA